MAVAVAGGVVVATGQLRSVVVVVDVGSWGVGVRDLRSGGQSVVCDLGLQTVCLLWLVGLGTAGDWLEGSVEPKHVQAIRLAAGLSASMPRV